MIDTSSVVVHNAAVQQAAEIDATLLGNGEGRFRS